MKQKPDNNRKILSPLGRARVGLKVCGMKHDDNILEVAKVQPDFMGFIFYENSPRNFEGDIPQIDSGIKKVGVFVNSSTEVILEKVKHHKLDLVQLHGDESPEFCDYLKKQLECQPERQPERLDLAGSRRPSLVKGNKIKIIKVFSIKDEFDFDTLRPYEDICDYFLFDTKGKLPGGNGYTFDWKVLENYPTTKPYFLSGGIGLESVEDLEQFFKTTASKYCEVIDVNSRFEVEAGLKAVNKVEDFKKALNRII